MPKTKERKEENSLNQELEFNQAPPKDIFAYNELRSCSDLFRMYKDEILEIQPEFQRNEVWSSAFQTRFIDSLSKELPIPSMCFGYDKNKNKMKVIDGLQRMTSIIKFLDEEKEWKMSDLSDTDPRICGKTNHQIRKESPKIYDGIKNLSLPVTFLRVDYDKRDHNEYLYVIFHRLNSYGQKLNNQEIRNCIYSGPFNSLLKDLNENKEWKKLLSIKNDIRFSKVELILRFFAFHDDYKNYDGVLNRFLNEYMGRHRSDKDNGLKDRKQLFEDVLSLVFNKITDKKTLSKTSNAFVEGLFFGISKNLAYLKKLDDKTLKELFQKMSKLTVFREDNLREGVMKKMKVEERLNAVLSVFSSK
ncbi:MAG: DUF262 domain-containing protein [Patescibacteria group bacterium]|nr:DUF262 domain-containing protein [Patescibacteria group bacterium]